MCQSNSWQRHRLKMSLYLLPLYVLTAAANAKIESFSLTTYGEPCVDACAQRGFPYAWCHKKPSRNGTWVDRDYCSPSPGTTRYLEPCLTDCLSSEGRPFYWCSTRKTVRGDWDYCSPPASSSSSLDSGSNSCGWGAWGSWSACSGTCGSSSSRTRRRRMESSGLGGRVGHCSGEIEQSIRSCRMPECPAVPSSSRCMLQWSAWSAWSACNVTCGSGGVQKRTRTPSQQQQQQQSSNADGRMVCEGEGEDEDSVAAAAHETVVCDADPCGDIIQDGETTTHPAFPEQTLLGAITSRLHHGVSGRVFALGQRRVRVEEFRHDGEEEAVFLVGTASKTPGGSGSIPLAHPFEGEFFERPDDPRAPALGRLQGQTIDFTLPPNVEVNDIKWISVWGRKAGVSFGDLIIQREDEKGSTILPTDATSPASTDLQTSTVISSTTEVSLNTSLPPDLPELPRSIESKVIVQEVERHKQKQPDVSSSQQQQQQLQDPVPFTVIRVSSSVSQVRPEVRVKGGSSNSSSSNNESADATRFVTQDDNEEKPPRKLFDGKSALRERPPFLKPVAKFPEIKIAAVSENPTSESVTTTTERTASILTSGRRRRPFEGIFSKTSSADNATSTKLVENDALVTTTTTAAAAPDVETAHTNFTRIPVKENSNFAIRDEVEANTTQKSTSTNESVTAATSTQVSISSDAFRSTSSEAAAVAAEITTTVTNANTVTPPSTVAATTTPTATPTASSTATPTVTFSATAASAAASPAESSSASSTSLQEQVQVRGRGESRFKGNDEIRKLFGNRRPFLDKSPDVTTEPSERFRSSTFKQEEELTKEEGTTSTVASSSSSRRPFLNRFRPVFAHNSTLAENETLPGENVSLLVEESSTKTGFNFNRFRSTRAPEIVISTTEEPNQNSVSTARITDDERLKILTGFMKDEKTEKTRDEKKLITLDYPVDIDDNEFDSEIRSKFQKEETSVLEKPATAEDNPLGGRKGIVVKVPKKVAWNPLKTDFGHSNASISTTTASNASAEVSEDSFFVTPSSSSASPGAAYNPCDIADACGPNAKCFPRGSEPICSCSPGFSGIPRDGVPDPEHGCVRTPEKCGGGGGGGGGAPGVPVESASCPDSHSCVRNYCLPQCKQDPECALGERCVNANCIKICFYDAHCLAGEFCEKGSSSSGGSDGSGGSSGNGVCLAGCRRDTNCPFGQICVDDPSAKSAPPAAATTAGIKRCVDGCHFNNDCNVKTACVNSTCADPCVGFDECGTNAVCEVVSHAATCKCPAGFRELNSPYVACVPENMNLARDSLPEGLGLREGESVQGLAVRASSCSCC